MELVSLGKEVLQNIAEHAASYRIGQSVLRQLDRTLWVVEKCARWAVPPPLDQDERPQPELVRPLPWVFFLVMLITLRVTRETISLANLVMGKPPLRSADVVMYIQSKRRYIRTLKYQGNRMMRARTSTQPQEPWYSGLHSLFELTMCFRRQSHNYGNNNTTSVTNNDEVMVVTRPKRGQQDNSPVATNSETTMDRLIEKIMLDLDVESDEDSSFTLTNATSPKSDGSDFTESDQDTVCHQTSTPTQSIDLEISQTNGEDVHFSPNKNQHSSSTPEKAEEMHSLKENNSQENNISESRTPEMTYFENTLSDSSGYSCVEPALTSKQVEEIQKLEDLSFTETSHTENPVCDNQNSICHTSETSEFETVEALILPPQQEEQLLSPKEETENLLESETSSQKMQRSPKKDHKIANGRTVKSVPSKKKGVQRERRESKEARPPRELPSNNSF